MVVVQELRYATAERMRGAALGLPGSDGLDPARPFFDRVKRLAQGKPPRRLGGLLGLHAPAEHADAVWGKELADRLCHRREPVEHMLKFLALCQRQGRLSRPALVVAHAVERLERRDGYTLKRRAFYLGLPGQLPHVFAPGN